MLVTLVLGQLGTVNDHQNLSQKLPWRKKSLGFAWEGLLPQLTAPQDSLAWDILPSLLFTLLGKTEALLSPKVFPTTLLYQSFRSCVGS